MRGGGKGGERRGRRVGGEDGREGEEWAVGGRRGEKRGRGDGWMDGWMDGWTDGRMDGWMDGWMDGNIHFVRHWSANQQRSIFCETTTKKLEPTVETARETTAHTSVRCQAGMGQQKPSLNALSDSAALFDLHNMRQHLRAQVQDTSGPYLSSSVFRQSRANPVSLKCTPALFNVPLFHIVSGSATVRKKSTRLSLVQGFPPSNTLIPSTYIDFRRSVDTLLCAQPFDRG